MEIVTTEYTVSININDIQIQYTGGKMLVGSTGNSTGPHLHFEVRVNGRTTNPLQFVNAP